MSILMNGGNFLVCGNEKHSYINWEILLEDKQFLGCKDKEFKTLSQGPRFHRCFFRRGGRRSY